MNGRTPPTGVCEVAAVADQVDGTARWAGRPRDNLNVGRILQTLGDTR
jgi:hypothetical protein